jgi:hypothetical protein
MSRLGRTATLGQNGHAVDQLMKTPHGFHAVAFEATKHLRLNDDDTVLADALIPKCSGAAREYPSVSTRR